MWAVGASWTKCSERLLDCFFPAKCSLCGLLSGQVICAACRAGFHQAEPAIIQRTDDGKLAFRAMIYRYEDRAGQAVRRLKYSRATALATEMSGEIAQAVHKWDLAPDLIVPVPIYWTRRCHRGFNQAELLCEQLSTTPAALARIRATHHQVGLSRTERESNLAGAFQASEIVHGKRVLLVDDVVTSGHTARECAKALVASGAREVGILAYCGEV